MKISKKLEIFLEFLIFGLIMGVVEDLVVFKFASGDPITWKVVAIVVIVAIPFAIIGEVIVDKKDLFPTHNHDDEKK